MKIQLSKNNTIPIGVQIKEQLKFLIKSGVYKSGEKLPSINVMASELDVNKNTIVSVLKELQKEGYIDSRKGKGVYVNLNSDFNVFDVRFLNYIDSLIIKCKQKNFTLDELINLVSIRFEQVSSQKRAKILFILGINRKIVEWNVKKLKETLLDIDVEGLYLTKDLKWDKYRHILENADLIILPSYVYQLIKHRLPDSKVYVKTVPNTKNLKLLRNVDKKSKVAVIGSNEAGCQLMADIFASSGSFKPKYVLSLDNILKYKKDLKDIDFFVVCESAREGFNKIKIKEKEVLYFSDYIDESSLEEIQSHVKKISQKQLL